MQSLISAVAVLAFAAALSAQDPLAGTWKLDAAKTKYTAGTPPKDAAVTIEDQGDDLLVISTGTYADGSPLSSRFTVPKKGGLGQVQEGPYDVVTSKHVSATVIEITTMKKNGKEVMSRRLVVSRDGKTLRTTVKGKDGQGKAIAGINVFEKQ